jgi:formylmethanofuran dehydrogenase subunit E
MKPLKKTPFDVDEYIRRVESFHGHVAPGVIIGGFMVHMARIRMPEGLLFNAVCETLSCLPDAVQLLTPCTVGNGWLRVINLGRFALCLYDKHGGNGFRVFLDSKNLDHWPEIKAWFFGLKPKTEQDYDRILTQIKEAGEKLCGAYPVQVQPQLLEKPKKGKIVICPSCGEAYPLKDGESCLACQGRSPYVIPEYLERAV